MSALNGTSATITNPNDAFSDEQKQYLQGFMAGADTGRSMRSLGTFNASQVLAPAPTEEIPSGPEAIHFHAQNRFIAQGKKLVPEEKAKREKNALDRWDDIAQHARENKFPKGLDVLAWKYHGLFYVAPAQDSFMSRLRFAGGLLSAHQFEALADLSDSCATGTLDCTTRANLQIRHIRADATVDFLMGLQEAGIVSRGSGADNIRNVTGSALAGIDPHEIADTRALCRAMHHTILNHREMYGLPRKFNISFDGGGQISALEDTNDIGFSAVKLNEETTYNGQTFASGIYWRLALGGITGHEDFARDTGLMLREDELVPLAMAVVRVFIEHGDRTDRKKARLKYLLDAWGFDKYLQETQTHLGYAPARLPLEFCESRAPIARTAHIGVHPQKQDGLHYIGVVLPVGHMTSEQVRRLATVSKRYGSGQIRLTVWQNLLISDIKSEDLEAACQEILDMGLDYRATNVRAGLVACTGKAGCKFGLAYTKQNAMDIANYLDDRITFDAPLNIHVTGCHNSCAQHYIGDIGLKGAAATVNDESVEGYALVIGGGVGPEQGIARELLPSIPADQAPIVIEKLLREYLRTRTDIAQSFVEWSRAQDIEHLRNVALAN